jgi:hypothetical protein
MSPPDELYWHYYNTDQDRKWANENLEREAEIIRNGIKISKVDRDIEAAERSQQRTELHHPIMQQRNWVKWRFHHCQYFNEDACRRWADRTSRIAEDDVGEVRQLREDFGTAADNYRHDLQSIVETIIGESAQEGQGAPQPDAPSPRIGPRSREWRSPTGLFGATRTYWPKKIEELRRQILACEHLRDGTRQEWLSDFPPSDLTYRVMVVSLELWELTQADSLRRKVEEEAKSVQREADSICTSLELLRRLTEIYAAI